MNFSTKCPRASSVNDRQKKPTKCFPRGGIHRTKAYIFKFRARGNRYRYAIVLPNGLETQLYKAVGDLCQCSVTIRKVDGIGVLHIASINSSFFITDLRSGLMYFLSRAGRSLLLYEIFSCGRKNLIAVVRLSKSLLFGLKKSVIWAVDEETKISSFGRKKFSLWKRVIGGNVFQVKSAPEYDVLMSVAVQLCCDSIRQD